MKLSNLSSHRLIKLRLPIEDEGDEDEGEELPHLRDGEEKNEDFTMGEAHFSIKHYKV
jgi:hypothetical protein